MAASRYIALLLLANLLQYLSSYTSVAYQDAKVHSVKQQGSADEVHQVSFSPLEVMCEINGVNVPAIIDTGAQISIMSLSCAKRCKLAGNIDPRHAGKAFGVGSGDIVGRINKASIRMGPVTFDSQLSILRESRVEFLIGLDFLRRFKCDISLVDNIMRFQVRDKYIRIPFASQTYDVRSRYNGDDASNSISVENEARSSLYGAGDEERGSGGLGEDMEKPEEDDSRKYEQQANSQRATSLLSRRAPLLHKALRSDSRSSPSRPTTTSAQDDIDSMDDLADEDNDQDFVSMEGI